MKNFRKDINSKIMVFDGAMGTMLQNAGLTEGDCPEMWNLSNPEKVKKIYQEYKDAGSDMIETNTFGATRVKLDEYGYGEKVNEINRISVELAREVMGDDGYVVLSVGPTGRLLEPYGDLSFEEAYEAFKEQVMVGESAGADAVNLETFTDIGEIRAAILAVKENTSLPVMCSMTFEESGRTLMGTNPETAAIILEALGVNVIGSNCSGGPKHLLKIVRELSQATNLPLLVKPNAGLPEVCCGETHYTQTPEDFSKYISEYIGYGAAIIGGCCGTSPEFIKAIKEKVQNEELKKNENQNRQLIASATNVVDCAELKDDGLLGITITDENSEDIVEVIMGKKEEKHKAVLVRIASKNVIFAINNLQSVVKLPIIFDTEDLDILKQGLRYYNGKAGIIVGGEVNLEVIEIARTYGAAILDKSLL